MLEIKSNQDVHLVLLKMLEENPNSTQRDLAKAAGISLGKLNYCLRALVQVGFVKMANFARSENKKKYAYIITPKGAAEKAKITIRFLEQKQHQFELLKQEIEMLKEEVRQQDSEPPM